MQVIIETNLCFPQDGANSKLNTLNFTFGKLQLMIYVVPTLNKCKLADSAILREKKEK